MSTSNISLFQQAEQYHFKFQKGMYLSEQFEIDGAMIWYSDLVEDFFWNYATRIQVTSNKLTTFVGKVAKFLDGKSRASCFYLTPWSQPKKELEELLQGNQYAPQFRDAWMFFDPESTEEPTSIENRNLKIVAVNETTDFIAVFAQAYGGEPTEDEPYGGLPDTYIKALARSFTVDRDVNTFHFVTYTNGGDAVSIATLVYKDGWGCVYNVGTPPDKRGKGYGTAVSRACIDKWRELGGHSLFLQTEVGSKVERWYESMGFVTRFVGEGWALAE